MTTEMPMPIRGFPGVRCTSVGGPAFTMAIQRLRDVDSACYGGAACKQQRPAVGPSVEEVVPAACLPAEHTDRRGLACQCVASITVQQIAKAVHRCSLSPPCLQCAPSPSLCPLRRQNGVSSAPPLQQNTQRSGESSATDQHQRNNFRVLVHVFKTYDFPSLPLPPHATPLVWVLHLHLPASAGSRSGSREKQKK